MAHDDYKAMLPALALTALDKQDERALKEHLAACEECAPEMDQWLATAAALAYESQPLEPSSELRERIVEAVRREAIVPSVARVIPLRPRTARQMKGFRGFAAIAAALIFVALVAGLIILWRENRAARSEIARLGAQINNSQDQLHQQREILALLTRVGTRMAELAGTKDAPTAHAVLAFDNQSGNAVLVAQGLPPAPAGKAYQLWFIAGGKPLPGSVFKTDAAGNAVLHDQVPAGALDSAVFAVTLEPQGGVSSPTGAMYLLSPTRSRS
jgi:anti-sigma-K factor RskA